MKWKIARQQALERDGYTCRLKNNDCSKRLSVHHINPAIPEEQENELSNLMTVCNAHHRILHSNPFREITKYKMVKLSDETHKELLSVGQFRETINDIVQKVVKCYKEEFKK